MKNDVKHFSLISFFLCSILMVVSGSLFYPRWQKGGGEAQLSWDAGGYYWYLPSTFIFHDLKGQSFKDSILQKYTPTPPNDFQYASEIDNSGTYVLKYTMGTALLESPGFFIAHTLAKPLGYDADGFSKPYQFMAYLSSIIFALLGLWYLRKLLCYYYSDIVVATTLFILVFGTNYLNYAGIDVGMTHTWLFTLYVFIILNTHHFYQSFKLKYALRIGFLIGLIALVRPPEIIAVFIPLLWGLNSISIIVFKERIALFKKNGKAMSGAIIIALGLLSLQFIYWKIISGHWFVYTYQNQGFSWLSPHLKQYALNYQSGWLLYTPVMFFAVFGLIFCFKRIPNKIAIIFLAIVNYYIVASWDAWDYGGRAMVQSYPILLFPLASLIQVILIGKWKKVVFVPLLLLCTYFNLWWTYQAHGGGLMGGVPATGTYYWSTMFRYNLPLEYQKLRDNTDEYMKPVKGAVLIYDGSLKNNVIDSFLIEEKVCDSVSILKPIEKFRYIRASADFRADQKEWNVWFMTQFIIRLKKGNNIVHESTIRVQRLLNDNETKNITTDIKTRGEDYDTIQIFFKNDNAGTSKCHISNLKIFGFNH